MTEKRFTYPMKDDVYYSLGLFRDNGKEMSKDDVLDMLNNLYEENQKLKEENNKLHTKIFEMRTNIALERTEISRQPYTGKKNKKEYLDSKEFLDEMEKW